MSTPSSAAILTYWHHNLWRSALNKLSIPKQYNFQFINSKEVSFPQSSSNQWVAPFVGKKENEEEYWIPLWIPCSDNQLPWMPPIHFEALLGQSPFSEQLHSFDDWCRFEWLTEENTLAFDTWAKVLKSCKKLLDNLSDKTWQERIKELGFTLLDQVIVIEQKPEKCQQTKLLESYASYDESECKPQLTNSELYENTKLLCGQLSGVRPLTGQELISAVHALLLAEGELIAIKAPIGSDKEKWLSTVLASFEVNAALKNQTIPSIVSFNQSELYKYHFEVNIDQGNSLQACYDIYLQGLKLASELSILQETIEEDDIDIDETQSDILDLQLQDEEYEEQLGALQSLQAEFIKKTTRRSFWSWFLPSPKLNIQDLQYFTQALGEENLIDKESVGRLIIEKMRYLKVKRTKIHQELVESVEMTARVKGIKERWVTWLKDNTAAGYQSQDLLSDIAHLQSHFGQKLYALIATKPGFWQKTDKILDADLLIVDNANRLLPQEILPLLGDVKRAIFLGDNQDITAFAVMSAMPEEWDLKAYGFDDEECIEQLQYKGMLASTGNAFSVALSNSSYQQLLEHGINSANLSLSENDHQPLHYHCLQVGGASEPKGNALINQDEATAIVNWLVTGPLITALHNTLIVTPFPSQKELIEQQLQAKSLTCDVMTCCELPDKQWQNVVFSPVYTSKDQRPFIFDQGDHLLYAIITRAKNNLWIVGDLGIFDSKMHSPSGNLAKRLFAVEKERVAEISE
ncbi:MAG: hypothetical protein HYX61_00660 [Gammaproteobacteria bacterium]|jgi:hypothetical protein|nr:hypothetical protein [Gammaproteobacteria bacterium]